MIKCKKNYGELDINCVTTVASEGDWAVTKASALFAVQSAQILYYRSMLLLFGLRIFPLLCSPKLRKNVEARWIRAFRDHIIKTMLGLEFLALFVLRKIPPVNDDRNIVATIHTTPDLTNRKGVPRHTNNNSLVSVRTHRTTNFIARHLPPRHAHT